MIKDVNIQMPIYNTTKGAYLSETFNKSKKEILFDRCYKICIMKRNKLEDNCMCFQKKQNRFAQNIIGKKTKIENKELTEKEKKEANVKFKEFLKTMKVDKEN